MTAKDRRLPDSRGYYGQFGGRFIPETLILALNELEMAYAEACADSDFRHRHSSLPYRSRSRLQRTKARQMQQGNHLAVGAERHGETCCQRRRGRLLPQDAARGNGDSYHAKPGNACWRFFRRASGESGRHHCDLFAEEDSLERLAS